MLAATGAGRGSEDKHIMSGDEKLHTASDAWEAVKQELT
jgi:hypothetical protein